MRAFRLHVCRTYQGLLVSGAVILHFGIAPALAGPDGSSTTRIQPRTNYPDSYTPPSSEWMSTGPATLSTDKSEYLLGEIVEFSGTGYKPREIINLLVTDTTGMPCPTWSVMADASGAFACAWIIPIEAQGIKLVGSGEGGTSGLADSTTFLMVNTNLDLESDLPDVLCPGDTITVCAILTQGCGGSGDLPLEGREVIFFFNDGNCGANVGQAAEDSATTDADGVACILLTVPSIPGSYTLRGKFRGEDKPDPCPNPGNSACDPTDANANQRCVNLSSSNICEPFEVNHPPVTIAPPDFSISLCDPDTVCVPGWSEYDPDFNLDHFIIPFGWMAGPGLICFEADTAGVYLVICCAVDECDEAGCDTTKVTVTINEAPTIVFGPDQTVEQCAPSEICLPYTVSDPDGLAGLVEMQVSGPGDIDTVANQVCFTPAGAGTYTIIVKVTDTCESEDRDTIVVTVTVPSPPTIAFGADLNLKQCVATQICLPYVVSDPDGLAGLVEMQVSGPGDIDTAANQICFTPAGSGTVTIVAKVTDPCGATDFDTINVTVDLNDPPVIALEADFAAGQCAALQVCANYTISDPDGLGKLVETLVSGPPGASLDSLNNKICFTPTSTGLYSIIAQVTDSCGLSDVDTIDVTVTVNQPPVIAFGPDFTLFQCVAAEICVPYTVSDPNGLAGLVETLISGPPLAAFDTAGNQVCFTPGAAGTYTIIARVTDPCGSTDDDTIKVTVNLNRPPISIAPNDTTIRLCDADTICIGPFPEYDYDHNVASYFVPFGWPQGGGLCFLPDTSGYYMLICCVTDSCGLSDCDTAIVHVILNTPPVCNVPDNTTIIDCDATELCLPVSASDADGDPTTCEIVSGPGTLVAGNWCYTPSGDGIVTVVIRCTDTCDAFCEESFTVTFDLNEPPVCDPAQPSPPLCVPDTFFFPISVSDPNQVIDSCRITSGPGWLSGGSWFYEPTGGETVNVTVCCYDDCGDSCCVSFSMTFPPRVPPVCDIPTENQDFTLCGPGPVCVAVSGNSPNPPVTCTVIRGPGAVVENQWCYTAGMDTSAYVVIRCQDICEEFCEDSFLVNVTITDAPVCNLPASQTIKLCAPSQICLPVSATGTPAPTCVVVSGPGSVVNGNWCYTPTGPGVFNVTIRCTNSCDQSCEGSFTITVIINQPPFITIRDSSLFQCAPTVICVPYQVSDPNGLAKLTEALQSGPPSATIDTLLNRVCFLPTTAGTYTLIVKVADSCEAMDFDTSTVVLDLNDAPVLTFGPDVSVELCEIAQVCVNYDVTDLDGLAGHVESMISAPSGATINTTLNRICFTPGVSGTFTIVAGVTDPCGLGDRDTIVVTVALNRPPVCSLPSSQNVFQCSPTQICLPVSATDPDGNFSHCAVTAGPGTIVEGNWCFTPTGSGTYNVTIRCYDLCDQSCEGSFSVTVDLNEPPQCSIINDSVISLPCVLEPISIPVVATDPDGNFRECIAAVTGIGLIPVTNGMLTFTPTAPDEYCITLTCTDSCDAECQEMFCVTVILDCADFGCLYKLTVNGGVSVGGLNGEAVVVPIMVEIADLPMGGFDLLLCYDETGIYLTEIEKGPSLSKWEYFTYRLGYLGNCTGGGCPSGIVRLVGITEMNNGVPVTDPNAFLPLGTIAELTFVITPDRNFIGQCIPIRWCWYQCGDNTLASKSGDTTFLALGYDYDSCLSNPKGAPVPGICFEDGRVCILEPPDDRGDLNLNGIANEVGDAVLYTNFFIYGQSVWNTQYKAVQILASDINDDGIVLTVADLIYLIRIITGDEQPFPPGGNPKIVTADPASISTDISGDRLSIGWNSELAIGGAHFIVDVPRGQLVREVSLLAGASNMTLRTSRSGNELRVLVFSESGEEIAAGSQQIVSITMADPNSATLSTTDLSTDDGWVMPSMIGASKAAIPSEFTVVQNYPNPFNAGTVIRFGSKVATDYKVSIYNILGNRIWEVSGHTDPGWVDVAWDGHGENGQALASGIYLYRVETTAGVETRKMTLLK